METLKSFEERLQWLRQVYTMDVSRIPRQALMWFPVNGKSKPGTSTTFRTTH